MKYLGLNKCWKKLAKDCLRKAVKEGDFDCVCYETEIFSLLCDMADVEENEIIVAIRMVADKRSKK